MIRKVTTLFILLLFILMIVVPSNAIIEFKEVSTVGFDGDTLYVGGSGEGNYTKIQDAIDNASDGDTVFVFDYSSPYYENLIVDKSINLIGEDKNTTVIDGNIYWGNVVNVTADWVNISGFLIKNSEYNICRGIDVKSAGNCHIFENIIKDNYHGIFVQDSLYCIITGNIFDNNTVGIKVEYSLYVYISKNIVTNSAVFGIYIDGINDSCICEFNHIERTAKTGIFLAKSNSNIIKNNNFIRNKHHAGFKGCNNNWAGNYWNRPRILPKIIFGYKGPIPPIIFFNMIDFDWLPATEPYDI